MIKLRSRPQWRVPGGERWFSDMKDPRLVTSFADFGLPSRVTTKFPKPTDMQKKMLAAVQSGNSVIARSAPGTGKSVAAALSLSKCQKADPLRNIVLVPTGSLAQQYGRLLNSLKLPGKQLFRTGKDYNDEIQHKAFINGAPTLIATPTRLLDYLSYDLSLISTENLETIVIDELDVFEKPGKLTDLEILLEYLLSRAPNPRLITMTSVRRSLEFQKLAKIFDHQNEKRRMLDISTDWGQVRAKLSVLDPDGKPLTSESTWTHTPKINLDKYLQALKRSWSGQGIVVVPSGVSTTDLTREIFKRLKEQVLVVHDQDLAGVNIPDLDRLYVLGWQTGFDMEKLLRTPQGTSPSVCIVLTTCQTPQHKDELLQAKNELNYI